MRDGLTRGNETGVSALLGYASRRGAGPLALCGTLGVDGAHAEHPGDRGSRRQMVQPLRQGVQPGVSYGGLLESKSQRRVLRGGRG
jgi:hypothetical protein